MRRTHLRRLQDYARYACIVTFIGFAFNAALRHTALLDYETAFGCGVMASLLGVTGEHVVFPRLRRLPFAAAFLFRALGYVVILSLAVAVPLWVTSAIDVGEAPFANKTISRFRERLTEQGNMQAVLVIGTLTIIGFTVFESISRKLGPGVLRNWMLGRYHHPREEERIFMFLDLKGSTTLAEQLGNLKFSALVRDFFADLTVPLLETHGEVSHFIGDEAVITWRPEKGLADADCLRCFFLFEDEIDRNAEHYLKLYGLKPEFKAGVHIGKVVATEVGNMKSEIVFHGDVLNTTARLQAHCSEVGARLLVSGDLVDLLSGRSSALTFKELPSAILKGKQLPLRIYECQRLRNS